MAGHSGLVIEPAARRLDHGLGADRLDLLRPFLDVADGLADRQRRAVPTREVGLAVAGVNRVGDEPRLGALELARLDALAA